MNETGPHSHPDEQEQETPLRSVEPASTAGHLLAALRDRDRERFRLEGEIARGGMGAILKVHDESLQRDLAMKVILPERRDGDSGTPYVHRFLEEAQVTAQLDHPGVVPVHELGADDDGQIFFTMKLVKGRTLAEIFELVRKEEDEWSQPRALQVFLRVCETLAFAHVKGVIHRDLKPANIMVGAFGEVYVMDWGLAKVLGGRAEPETARENSSAQATLVRTTRKPDSTGSGDSPTATLAGDVLGTPSYMPLEQAILRRRGDALRTPRRTRSVRRARQAAEVPRDPHRHGGRAAAPPLPRGEGRSGGVDRHLREGDGARSRGPLPDGR
jgi:serine/threonine-protein kinase